MVAHIFRTSPADFFALLEILKRRNDIDPVCCAPAARDPGAAAGEAQGGGGQAQQVQHLRYGNRFFNVSDLDWIRIQGKAQQVQHLRYGTAPAFSVFRIRTGSGSRGRLNKYNTSGTVRHPGFFSSVADPGSELDPDSIVSVYPDPGGQK